VPTSRLSTVGSRAFPIADPQTWNNLPEDVTINRIIDHISSPPQDTTVAGHQLTVSGGPRLWMIPGRTVQEMRTTYFVWGRWTGTKEENFCEDCPEDSKIDFLPVCCNVLLRQPPHKALSFSYILWTSVRTLLSRDAWEV